MSGVSEKEAREKIFLLGTVFSPAAPIQTRDLFYGRLRQLDQVHKMVNERGQHGILFGERGVGKTSIANIFAETYSDAITTKVICNRHDSFKDVWIKALKQISFLAARKGVGFVAQEKQEEVQLDLFIKDRELLRPDDIQHALSYVKNNVLLIFDEFDSIADAETKRRFADMIKAMSDGAPKIKLLIVGIGDSVTDLIGEHPSIERCVRQIKLPRMSNEELSHIIDNGLSKLGMSVDGKVKSDIIGFSDGFPHYTHLLAKYSASIALSSRSVAIERPHFDFAILESIEDAQESVRDAFQRAVLTTKPDAMFLDTLFACAMTPEDEHGTFRASDVGISLEKLRGKASPIQAYIYHLGKFCHESRGPVLQRTAGKKARYRFRNPLLKAYVRIRLYQLGQLSH